MIDVNIKFNKTDLTYVKSLPSLFNSGIIKGLRKATLFAEGEAKKGFGSGGGLPNPPPGPLKVRTGHLRRSIRSGVIASSLTGWIGTEVFYGKVHEPTRPFLSPAVENNVDSINDMLRDSILKEFK